MRWGNLAESMEWGGAVWEFRNSRNIRVTKSNGIWKTCKNRIHFLNEEINKIKEYNLYEKRNKIMVHYLAPSEQDIYKHKKIINNL